MLRSNLSIKGNVELENVLKRFQFHGIVFEEGIVENHGPQTDFITKSPYLIMMHLRYRDDFNGEFLEGFMNIDDWVVFIHYPLRLF